MAPAGYTIASETKFSIDANGKVTVDQGGTITDDGVILIEDELTKVKVSKTDMAGSEELEGATIQILDENNAVVEIDGKALKWVSKKGEEIGRAHV